MYSGQECLLIIERECNKFCVGLEAIDVLHCMYIYIYNIIVHRSALTLE